MSQIFDSQGRVIPVSLIEAGPCSVSQIKTDEKDGYSAVQVSFRKVKREFTDGGQFKVKDKIDTSVFRAGEIVKISGQSKGKGFQGVVKRHGFSGFPASHGTKHGLRAPGSIGSAFPERVWPGRKMAGRMGGGRITVLGLEIAKVDKENNLLAVKGAVPGKKGTLLEIIATKEIEKEIENEDKASKSKS